MADSTLTTFVASDGDNLAIQDWPLDPQVPLRGVVLLVHGLGEHAGRYDALARQLNSWGFAVRGYDQYGHGESGGVRGGLPSASRLVDDLADILHSTRRRMPRGCPLVLLGHSMGGLVAAQLVAQGLGAVDGLVLSSPALALRLNPLQRLLLSFVPDIAPQLRLHNGVRPEWLSHDAAVVAAYRADRLVHHRISARLARFMDESGRALRQAAPGWSVPTLLLYGGADRVVDPRGSAVFAQAAPAGVLSSRCFEGLYHEIFNEREPERSAVLDELQRWLDRWFPAMP
jgi:alpha-beta hydrolase superfamily lysophospholipase